MTSLDELRRTLEERAALAPDATGVVEQARAGAGRLRRRNRIRTVVGAVAAVAVAVAVPSVIRSNAPDPVPNPAGPMTHYRESYQLTVELAPGPVYFTMTHGTHGRTQFLIARPKGNPPDDSGATVAVHDPGTFDPTRLRRGERVTVHGHPAFYVEQLDPPAPDTSAGAGDYGRPTSTYRTGAAVGWQDPSGAWVIVSEGANRAAMLRLAESVRLTAPHTARAPVRFGWVPRDLPVTFTESRDIAEYGVSASIGFGGPADLPGQSSDPSSMPQSTPLSVLALPMDGIMTAWGEHYTEGPMRVIRGNRTWYVEDDAGNLSNPDGGQLMIDAGSCAITILVRDRKSIPYAEIKRMAENMTIGGCDDTSDWRPIVGP